MEFKKEQIVNKFINSESQSKVPEYDNIFLIKLSLLL